MGPMATAKFMEIVINNTKADCDQDNVDMVICQYASIPDRTNYILNEENDNPVSEMIEAAKTLEQAGCSFLVMPCNTATYFYDKIQKEINIPLLNIARLTADYCKNKNAKKVGLMATSGTIKAKVYDQFFNNNELFIPSEEMQNRIMDVIYKEVKQNKIPDKENFLSILDYFRSNNCDLIIMGCTELSVAINELNINDSMIVDSLTVLARNTIEKAGKLLK